MSYAPPTETASPAPRASWPVEGGIAGAALRTRNWSQSPLGPVEHWPGALRTITDLLLASAFPMTLLWGPELIQIFNDGYGEILGARRATAMGQPTRDCWPEVWHFNEPIYQRVRQGETLRFDNQLFPITRHGFLEQAYFTLCYSPVRSDGNIAGVLVTVFETTARVQAEAQRREAEQETRYMAESLPQLTWTADPEGAIIGCSRRWCDITGMTREQTLGDGWAQVPHPEDLGRMRAAWRRAVATGEPYDTTVRLRMASGEYCWMRVRATPHRNSSGRILKWYGTVEDVDERVKTVQALQSSEERLRMAQEGGSIVTWDWDLATDCYIWTGDTARLFGCPPDQLADLESTFQRIHPDDRDAVAAATQPAIEGRGEFHSEFRALWPDGSVHWLEGRGKPVLSPEGKPVRIVGINLDLTARKQAEAALLQSEKLAAVGRLASTIAHEINNPLESITNLLYLLNRNQDLTPESRRFLDLAEAELRRASHITAQTLRFHRQSTFPTEADIGELLDSVLSLYAVRLRSSVIQVQRRCPRPLRLLCREGDIRQVLNNLVANAFDALRSGGTLHLRARAATDWETGRRGVRITVADSGDGMSPETRRRLFDAFYTTKGSGGNGLGLWVSKGIIDNHHGRIRLKSAQHAHRHGTAFSLFLPQMPSEAANPPSLLEPSLVH